MQFPALKVRDLEGEDHVIPHGLTGGPHMIIVAFQRWHQALVDRWEASLRPLAERHPGVEIWEVPSISKGYRLFRAGIDGGMAAAIADPDVRRHTLTTYTDLGQLGSALEIDSFETVHVFLVDCQGAVLWRGAGEPSDGSPGEIEAALPEAS